MLLDGQGVAQDVHEAVKWYHDGADCHSACNIDPLSRGIGVQNWL
jgi:TPR repeat protein